MKPLGTPVPQTDLRISLSIPQGLDHETERIIEIAVIVTDGELRPVDEGIEYVIRTDKQVLDSMGEWCIKTHGVRASAALAHLAHIDYWLILSFIFATRNRV
jgi:oligoribonuclease (3'-5' exoribonuclease)